MILFPPCKINLGLSVTSKRNDGYHNLETIMFQIPWNDILEIVPTEKLIFKTTGLVIEGDQDSNLCLKAFKLIQQRFNIPNVTVHLHKIIPMGAGLGGGSSDGTYTLLALNKLFNLKLNNNQLREFALELGSDCPLFVINSPQYARGRGEILNPIEINLKGYYIHLVNIGIHVSTKIAFKNLTFSNDSKSILDIIKQPIIDWKYNLTNDFEKNVFQEFPKLNDIKNELYKNGAIYASMTGSGSTIFGIYPNKPKSIFSENNVEKIEKIIQIK